MILGQTATKALTALYVLITHTVCIEFDDSLYVKQWYLERMNIKKAWEAGYNGKGIVISVVDQGMQPGHDEFKKRWDQKSSMNAVTNSLNPSPFSSSKSHGMKVGGVAAAGGGNGKCGVGVAYGANIGAINIANNDEIRDKGPAQRKALAYARDHIDIYACAWGPVDPLGVTVGYNKAHDTMREGVEKGRNGKGSIYIFGAGNDGVYNDACTYDGYVSSLYSFAISTISHDNKMSVYSEFCPCISAVAYVRSAEQRMDDNSYLMPTASVDNSCDTKFTATSAATGVAAGVFALTLQANGNLTWRDLHYIIALTAMNDKALDDTFKDMHKWKINGGGFKVSNAYGFGVLDAFAMVKLAKNWTNVPKQKNCDLESKETRPITFGVPAEFEMTVKDSSCQINYLEHVVLTINSTFYYRRDLQVKLESPNGTVSYMLISGRSHDKVFKAVKMYPVKTMHHWGENPVGNWKVTFESIKMGSSGSVTYFKLDLYGIDTSIVGPTLKPIRPSIVTPASTTMDSTTKGPTLKPIRPSIVTPASTTMESTTKGPTGRSSKWGWYVGAAVLVIVIIIVAVLSYLYIRKRNAILSDGYPLKQNRLNPQR